MNKCSVFEPQRFKLFPEYFTIFSSGRLSSSNSRDGGVLMAVSSRVRDCKRKYDLQLYEECVWVEIPNQNHRSLRTGIHDFHPDN